MKGRGTRVTTVFPREGRYAHDPGERAEALPADVTVERIADLLDDDPGDILTEVTT